MKKEVQNNLQVFTYEGREVTFDLQNGHVMVNLTEVAKAFPDKNLSTIINSQEISEYVQKLSERTNVSSLDLQSDTKLKNFSLADNQLLRVVRGGSNPGTWAHRRVALRVAQKLSAEFAIWVDETIETLLKHGVVATENKIEEFLANPDLAIQAFTALKQEREKSRMLESQVYQKESHIEVLECEIKQAVPKVQYHDEVMSSDSLLTTTQIAKNYGWSAIKLNNILKSLGVQFKQSGNWVLYQKYADKGFAKLVPYPYPKSDGTTGTSYELKWFEAGKKFIHNLLKSEGYIS